MECKHSVRKFLKPWPPSYPKLHPDRLEKPMNWRRSDKKTSCWLQKTPILAKGGFTLTLTLAKWRFHWSPPFKVAGIGRLRKCIGNTLKSAGSLETFKTTCRLQSINNENLPIPVKGVSEEISETLWILHCTSLLSSQVLPDTFSNCTLFVNLNHSIEWCLRSQCNTCSSYLYNIPLTIILCSYIAVGKATLKLW